MRPGGLPAGHGLAACRGGSPAVPRPTASYRPLPLAAVAMPRCVPRWPRPPCRSAPRLPWRPRPPRPRRLGSWPWRQPVLPWRPRPPRPRALGSRPGGLPRRAVPRCVNIYCAPRIHSLASLGDLPWRDRVCIFTGLCMARRLCEQVARDAWQAEKVDTTRYKLLLNGSAPHGSGCSEPGCDHDGLRGLTLR